MPGNLTRLLHLWQDICDRKFFLGELRKRFSGYMIDKQLQAIHIDIDGGKVLLVCRPGTEDHKAKRAGKHNFVSRWRK